MRELGEERESGSEIFSLKNELESSGCDPSWGRNGDTKALGAGINFVH